MRRVKPATWREFSPEENARAIVVGLGPTIEMSQPTPWDRAPEVPAALDAIRTYKPKHGKDDSPPLLLVEELAYALGENQRKVEGCGYAYSV